MQELRDMEIIQKAFIQLERDDQRALEDTLELVQIPAPSYKEGKKAERVLRKMEEIGLDDVHMDEVGNVFGTIKGTENGPKLILAAHTDTVFPMETDVTVRKEGERYFCPGISDDTRAVAEILSIARTMKALDLHGEGDIVFCANVCEEGLGDLRGVKHIFREEAGYDGFVSIDSAANGKIIYGATGSNRYLVTFQGKGGHSFNDFGIPNPIHAMGRAISAISDLQVPSDPKTSFSVGVIEGGTSVNTIAAKASMLVDLRSNSTQELERLTEKMKQAVYAAVEAENARWDSKEQITAEIDMKGKRPAGRQDQDSPIVRAAWDAISSLGMEPDLCDEASTDANLPISLGIPAVTVGQGGKGGGTHTVQEWFEPADSYKGPQKNLLLILALSGFGGFRKYQLSKIKKVK